LSISSNFSLGVLVLVTVTGVSIGLVLGLEQRPYTQNHRTDMTSQATATIETVSYGWIIRDDQNGTYVFTDWNDVDKWLRKKFEQGGN